MNGLANDESDTANAPEATSFYRIVVLTLSAVVIGALVALAAIAFIDVVGWLNDVLLVSPRTRVQVQDPAWLVPAATVLVPTIGGLLVGLLIQRLSPEARPLGPPDVIQSVQQRQSLPSARGGAISTIAAAISLGFGASVGQYGPMVYLGALIGNAVERLNLNVRNLPAIAMACGVAAAISTAFNAPIAGLVFAHEVILRHYSMRAFAPTTVASATGYVIANVIFERPALFLVEFSGVEHGYEFPLFAIIGLVAAMIAVAFMRMVLAAASHARASRLPPMLRPAAAGLILGMTALWLPDVLGVGKEALRFATIEGAFPAWELALLVVAKMALTALCIGYGFAGGVFSPALLIGILYGALGWTLLHGIGIPTSGIAVYAICGMMALTSPVIGAPLTCILIVFELTRNYDLTIAAMVSVVFANLIVFRAFGRSLFDVQLAARGFDLSAGREYALLSSRPVIELGADDYPTARHDEALSSVLDRLKQSPWSEVYVAAADGQHAGTFRPRGEALDRSAPIGNYLIRHSARFNESTTIWEAMRELQGFVGDAVPLVDSSSGKLLTVVTESSIIGAYLKIVHDLREEENAPA
ncbi:chloride channel protein [Gammaproteobacteria bacterium]|nr:chloride channel protein [Gammaproteobacteria bacterium]